MRHRDQDDMRRQPDAFKPGFMDSVSTKHAPFSKINSVQRPVYCSCRIVCVFRCHSQDYGSFTHRGVMPAEHTFIYIEKYQK